MRSFSKELACWLWECLPIILFGFGMVTIATCSVYQIRAEREAGRAILSDLHAERAKP